MSTASIDDLESRRVALYRQFADHGRVLTRRELAHEWSLSLAEVDAVLASLAQARHVVLDSDGEIELAHPFASRDFGFSVKSTRTLWWGGCAWDSFAIPHLVAGSSPVLVATTCPGCSRAHAWTVSADAPPEGDQVAHFLVPVSRVWDDVIHSCENQRLFCSETCVDAWLATSGETKGAVFSLDTLWRLSRDWYTGRLEHGYRRRQPEQAAEYFRSVGLVGRFWNNE